VYTAPGDGRPYALIESQPGLLWSLILSERSDANTSLGISDESHENATITLYITVR
jgi:hypothetical protein